MEPAVTWVLKHKPLPGAPMIAEYECPYHGRFELLVERDENGDPPPEAICEADDEVDGVEDLVMCCLESPLVISAPNIKYWSRDPVPIGRASKSDEKDPRMLDTEPLATGKMTRAEWNKWQRSITLERRYQKRLKSGRISKRIQVGGG
jgi:hypothetical protein